MSEILTVSHSKLSKWRRCRFAWNLSYVENWKPKVTAYPLRLGSEVHAFLEDYYRGVIEGEQDAIARLENFTRVRLANSSADDDLQIIANASALVKRYIVEFALFEDQGFIPVDVEKHYTVELETPKGRPYNFELYFDLLLLHQESGRLWMVDHKTHKSRPYSDTDIMMDPQLPAYAMVMREKLGIDIFGLMYNMLNTYDYKSPPPPEKLFLRKRTYRTPEELDSVLKEIGATVDDMIDNAENPIRNLTRDCSWCEFQDPCLMSMKGMDIQPLMEDVFEQKGPRPDAARIEEGAKSNRVL